MQIRDPRSALSRGSLAGPRAARLVIRDRPSLRSEVLWIVPHHLCCCLVTCTLHTLTIFICPFDGESSSSMVARRDFADGGAGTDRHRAAPEPGSRRARVNKAHREWPTREPHSVHERKGRWAQDIRTSDSWKSSWGSDPASEAHRPQRDYTRIAGEGVTVIEGGGGEEGVWTSSNVGAVGRWRRRPSLWCSRTPPARRRHAATS